MMNGSAKPAVCDRLAAAMTLARLNAVAHLPDHMIRETLGQCLMGYRLSLERTLQSRDSELLEAAKAFLTDLRSAGGPDEKYPDSTPEQSAQFVALLARL